MSKKIAIRRINTLYKKALEVIDENKELAKRYIQILEKIKVKYRIHDKNLRNKYCKKCKIPWIYGKTLSIRVRKGRIIYRCLECGFVKRFIIKKINLEGGSFRGFPD